MAWAAGSCHIGLAEGGVPIMAGLWNNPFAVALTPFVSNAHASGIAGFARIGKEIRPALCLETLSGAQGLLQTTWI